MLYTQAPRQMICPGAKHYSTTPRRSAPAMGAPAQNPSILLVTLNSAITNLARARRGWEALRLFAQLQPSHHLTPDHYSLVGALTACSSLGAPAVGAQLHARAVRSGLKSYLHVANSLLAFYSTSGGPASAHRLFNEISTPDVYSRTTLLSAYAKSGHIHGALQLFHQMPQGEVALWNALITGCVEQGHGELALQVFHGMRRAGVAHDHYTLAGVLSLCDSPELLDLGRQVHSLVVRTGFVLVKASVVNALVTMYFDVGTVADAMDIFAEASTHNEITYNAVIAGLTRWGRDAEALLVFKEMMEEARLRPTELTLVSVMSVCSSEEIGGMVHALAIKTGLADSTLVGNAAITMYSNCGNLDSARLVFHMIKEKDCVSLNSMISGYGQHACHEYVIEVYQEMQMAGFKPDEYTYGSLLVCSKGIEHAKMILALVKKNGLIINTYISNSLILAFAKYGDIQSAYKIFCCKPSRNLISWNSMLSAYLLNGYPVHVLKLFSALMRSELLPNSYTLNIVLGTCASTSALRFGKQVHAYILRSYLDSEISLANALITMYAKCGDVALSSRVFYRMPEKSIISWNAILAAYAQNGNGEQAISCFKKMQDSGVTPDNVTFINVLSGCSHAGLVNEAHWIFSSMTEQYGIEPSVDHYSCVVDLLGRAGHLDEVESLIRSMPYKLESRIWWVLLSSCSTYGHVRLGKIASNFLLEKEPGNPAVYVLLSNTNAIAGKWEEACSMREQMRLYGVVKQPGHSWLELFMVFLANRFNDKNPKQREKKVMMAGR
ncbi:hypothetical protein Taro_048795 [Colocasia esculenta]|uniref:Pentatricopeptide repeat-containing protein n=1 Tax=Colocasia esculenta TaxID=4460 RepID=A0A843X931_COLES|nr:hypothetical protein [Colocasia esculenta]